MLGTKPESTEFAEQLMYLSGGLAVAAGLFAWLTTGATVYWLATELAVGVLWLGIPLYEPGVALVRVIEQRSEFLRLLVQDTAGREKAMDARLRPGWCLMQSDTVVVAFTARRLGSETLLAHLEHQRLETPLPRRGQPHERSAALAKIDQELRTIETLAIQNSQ